MPSILRIEGADLVKVASGIGQTKCLGYWLLSSQRIPQEMCGCLQSILLSKNGRICLRRNQPARKIAELLHLSYAFCSFFIVLALIVFRQRLCFFHCLV